MPFSSAAPRRAGGGKSVPQWQPRRGSLGLRRGSREARYPSGPNRRGVIRSPSNHPATAPRDGWVALTSKPPRREVQQRGRRPGPRREGAARQGTRLARFALDEAAAGGATRAWLFSRRSGPFWQKLGFVPADRYELAAVLPEAEQVRLFVRSGQLEREVAWARDLAGVSQ